jgi:hypothetical protein
MLSSCRENPKKLHVKDSSLTNFQPPVVLIKQQAYFPPLSQKAHQKGKIVFMKLFPVFFSITISYYTLLKGDKR